MTRILLLLMLVLAGVTPSWTPAARRDEIDVTLTIIDEQGGAIPYATVWGYVLPRKSPLALDATDLWRLTTKYQSSFEFATPFNRIVPTMLIYPMSDGSGKAVFNIDYKWLEGSDAKRPAEMSIGFTVMKRRYIPSRIDFAVTRESRIAAKVVLKRNPESFPETQPYFVNYERLRFELSDTSRNEDISKRNHERIERLCNEMEATARQALDAGDKKAAARIYARMQHLPAIRFIDGKPAGFAQSDEYSEKSWGYLEKAYALDPINPYIAAEYVYRQGANTFGGTRYDPNASEEEQLALKEHLSRLHTLMRSHGEEIWPAYHQLYAAWHRTSNDPTDRERVTPLLEALYDAEPKFQSRERLLRVLR